MTPLAAIIAITLAVPPGCFGDPPAGPADGAPPISITFELPKPKSGFERAGQLAPTPAELGLKWIKGEPIDRWPAGKVSVVAYEGAPEVSCKNIAGRQRRPEIELRELTKDLGDHGAVFEIRDDRNVFVDDVESPLINWSVAKADYSTAGAILDIGAMETYIHAMIIDATGRIIWIGSATSTSLRRIADESMQGHFDAAAFAREQSVVTPLWRAFDDACRARNYDAADAALSSIEHDAPKQSVQVGLHRLRITKHRGADAAVSLARTLIGSTCAGDHAALLEISDNLGSIVLLKAIEGLDTTSTKELRIVAAEAAMDSVDRMDAKTIAEVAELHFQNGNFAQAVSRQGLAVAVAPPKYRADYQATLDKYLARLENGPPPEESSPFLPPQKK